jgi:hypothetical protein
MTDEKILAVLEDIRNWTRAASYGSVKATLEGALLDAKSRQAYQMLDGGATMERVRVACKMSPNALLVLAERCASMGLMGINEAKKRVRLFDLNDFGLAASIPTIKEKDERQTKEK